MTLKSDYLMLVIYLQLKLNNARRKFSFENSAPKHSLKGQPALWSKVELFESTCDRLAEEMKLAVQIEKVARVQGKRK